MNSGTVLESLEEITNHVEGRKFKIFDFVEKSYKLDKDIYMLRINTIDGYYSIDTLHGLAIYNNRKENRIIQLTKRQNDLIRYGYSMYRDN